MELERGNAVADDLFGVWHFAPDDEPQIFQGLTEGRVLDTGQAAFDSRCLALLH